MGNSKDLTKESPRSPRATLGGYAILARTLDKCRADLAGKIGEYHFDCPLDNMLFGFKGVKGSDFKEAVKSGKTDEEMVAWMNTQGTKKSQAEIEKWALDVTKGSMFSAPEKEKREYFTGECKKLGLNPEKTSTFEWLEADDKASFKAGAHGGASCSL